MPQLDRASAQRLVKAHPLLRKLFCDVAKRADIVILDSQHGRAAQELAYRTRRSKARDALRAAADAASELSRLRDDDEFRRD